MMILPLVFPTMAAVVTSFIASLMTIMVSLVVMAWSVVIPMLMIVVMSMSLITAPSQIRAIGIIS
jgi:hypothetical protein